MGSSTTVDETARSLINFVADRPGHYSRYPIDCTWIDCELGFRPSVAPTTDLGATVHWFIDNEPRWRAVMDRRYRNWITRQHGERADNWSPAAAAPPGKGRLWTESH